MEIIGNIHPDYLTKSSYNYLFFVTKLPEYMEHYNLPHEYLDYIATLFQVQ